MKSNSKSSRTLDIYSKLSEGKVIKKSEEAQLFNVDKRSIQRDIDDIRAFIEERKISNTSDNRAIVYDRYKKGYILTGTEGSLMDNSEILAVSKVLLASRAFTKNEMSTILNKLIAGCVPMKNIKMVSDLISNEKYHYVELNHKSILKNKLWEIGTDIQNHILLEIKYEKGNTTKDIVKRTIEPIAILFSEYYFYLNAFIVEKDENNKYIHKYNYPTIFRLDRIINYKNTGDKFKIDYANRFQEGELRKRIQFMYAGELMNILLRYTGNPEHILDRLPTAKIVSHSNNKYLIEAEVYGKGIIMWLLSEGPKIEVLKPESLRKEISELISDMQKIYSMENS